MFKIFQIIFLLIIFVDLKAQSIKDLEVKYGIKSLRLGTPVNEELCKQKPSPFTNPNIKDYSYTGEDLKSLFDVPTKMVTLTYYKNKLMSVYIDFNSDFTQSDFERIVSKLEKLFGVGTPYEMNDEEITNSNGRYWLGPRVSMSVARMYLKSTASWGAYFSVKEMNIEKEWEKEEF